MKRSLLALLFIVVISPAFAQTVKYGINGGLNEATILTGETPYSDSRVAGFSAGVFSDISFGNVSIQPGLYYITKGGKDKVFELNGPPSNYSYTAIGYVKEKISYLQLPVNILYHIKAGEGKFFLGGGPYIAYGLLCSSSTQSETTDGEPITYALPETNMLQFGNGEEDIKRIDFGLNATGGYMIRNGLFISAGFEYGLTKITNTDDKANNDVLTASLGYCF